MKKVAVVFALILYLIHPIYATTPPDEGMYLPAEITPEFFAYLQSEGLELSFKDFYNEEAPSLKDAVVGLHNGNPAFNFCTGEIVSGQGLVLTNHHCAYESIQSHSSIDHDYLTDGFWAKSHDEELPNSDVSASVLVKMKDVTDETLEFLKKGKNNHEKDSLLQVVESGLKDKFSQDGRYDVVFKGIYANNKYYVFVYETYRDVRLVGAPPSSIGKFGGDTDNWMWPRHTGDFSLYRIYTAPDGSPADYSEDNVPLKPKFHFKISTKGYDKNDFTMIWGFPGGTQRYLSSYGVKHAQKNVNPIIIEVEGRILEIMKEHMDADKEYKIENAANYAQIANSWKYYLGQNRGIKNLDVYGLKKEIEEDFIEWYKKDPDRKKKYANVLSDIKNGYKTLEKYNKPNRYFEEAIFTGNEYFKLYGDCFGIMLALSKYENPTDDKDASLSKKEKKIQKNLELNAVKLALSTSIGDYHNTYRQDVEKKLFKETIKFYHKNVVSEYHPDLIKKTLTEKFDNDYQKYTDFVFTNSILFSEKAYQKFYKKPNLDDFKNDPAIGLIFEFFRIYFSIGDITNAAQAEIDEASKLFITALQQIYKDKNFYPDANSTLRFSYGEVLDYYPADAVHYDFVTTLKGVIEKEDPENEEFVVHEKLKTLYKDKDFGPYGENDKMIVGFITNNDITGGNSGSPVLNSKGHLIGVAFDGNWEAMSSDIAFDPNLQRTINCDVRYVLFVIDKFAGAKHLIDEMTIVSK